MASIYRATDVRNNRTVASDSPSRYGSRSTSLRRFHVKPASANGSTSQRDARLRRRETLTHLHVMEWCPAFAAPDHGRRTHSHDRVIRITKGVRKPLNTSCQRSCHRDLKPENIMVDENDHIKLIDFGIAGDSSAAAYLCQLTATLGTPNYICRAVKASEATAAPTCTPWLILYEMLTGSCPYGPRHRGDERPSPEPPHASLRRGPFRLTPTQEVLYRHSNVTLRTLPECHAFLHDCSIGPGGRGRPG